MTAATHRGLAMARGLRQRLRQRHMPPPTTTYEDADLVDVVVRKTLAAREGQPVDSTTARLALPWLVASPRRVLDFGGGAGYRYFALREFIPADVSWHVVETPAMVERAREIDDAHLTFGVTVEGIQPDLVIACGALQFAPDPLAMLRELIGLAAPLILVTRTELSTTAETVRTVQQTMLSDNGPGPLPAGVVDRRAAYPVTAVPALHVEAVLSAAYALTPFVEHETSPSHALGTAMFGWLGRRNSPADWH